jgi:hypothetical protein
MMRNVALGVGAAATILAGGAIVADSALAAGATHTIKVSATVLKTVEPSNATSVETDRLTRAGKTVGFETQSCNVSQGEKCAVTFALKNGILLGSTTSSITTSSHGTFKGKITGGLGSYTGDKGTIKGSVDGIRATLTITYH